MWERCVKYCGMSSEAYLPACGSAHADIMVAGNSPGVPDPVYGRPYAGASLYTWQWCLYYAGLREEDLWITNLVRCTPGFGRQPPKHAVKQCAPFLQIEIETIRPGWLVLAGSIVADWVSEQAGVQFPYGEPAQTEVFGVSCAVFKTVSVRAPDHVPGTRGEELRNRLYRQWWTLGQCIRQQAAAKERKENDEGKERK